MDFCFVFKTSKTPTTRSTAVLYRYGGQAICLHAKLTHFTEMHRDFQFARVIHSFVFICNLKPKPPRVCFLNYLRVVLYMPPPQQYTFPVQCSFPNGREFSIPKWFPYNASNTNMTTTTTI